MNIQMNDTMLNSPSAIKTLMDGIDNTELHIAKSERYEWLARTLKQTGYFHLRKRDKSTVREYLLKVTGYSRQQLSRLIKQYKDRHWIGRELSHRNSFTRKYTREDILLLAKTDEAHETLSGPATKKLFERAYQIYQDDNYERLKNISISHLYNLRVSQTYKLRRQHYTKTQRTLVNLGERRKPNPNNQPGFIRIDTVHQGDQDKQKGIYHINAVDEVTQFEVVCSVEKISENHLISALETLLDKFPFVIINFHSDNGSEYINRRVVDMLNKLHISLTKSRARHSNDNALAESKNGSIVRKHLGYVHIPQKWAPLLNEFNQNYLTPYLNFHRPCYFPVLVIDKKGKEKKTYPYETMMTPYEKFKSLENSGQYLKLGITFDDLNKKAMAITDLESATQMKQARAKVFKIIFSQSS